MAATEEEAKDYEARFIALVSSISGSVMQHLGKVINPLTGKVERNLQAAREMIDILRMLRDKTKGNLTDREDATLTALIGNVQLNYLDEAKAEAEKPKEKAPEEKREEKPEEKPAAEEKKEPPPEEKKAEAAQQTAAASEQKADQPPAEETRPPQQKTGKKGKAKRGKRPPAEE